MSRTELYEEITALVDDEIKDNKRKAVISNLIEDDEDFQYEYEVQNSIKTLLREKYSSTPAPAYLYDSIIEKLTQSK